MRKGLLVALFVSGCSGGSDDESETDSGTLGTTPAPVTCDSGVNYGGALDGEGILAFAPAENIKFTGPVSATDPTRVEVVVWDATEPAGFAPGEFDLATTTKVEVSITTEDLTVYKAVAGTLSIEAIDATFTGELTDVILTGTGDPTCVTIDSATFSEPVVTEAV
jgi:hypothetical protein